MSVEIGVDEYFLRNFNVLTDTESMNNLKFLKSLLQKLKTPVRNISFPNYTRLEESLKLANEKCFIIITQNYGLCFKEKKYHNIQIEFLLQSQKCFF